MKVTVKEVKQREIHVPDFLITSDNEYIKIINDSYFMRISTRMKWDMFPFIEVKNNGFLNIYIENGYTEILEDDFEAELAKCNQLINNLKNGITE